VSAFIKRSFLALLLVILLASSVLAQDETPKTVNNQNRSGDLPFSSSVGTGVESVDIATGHLSIRIPFVAVPGRGTNYRLGLRYESGYWAAALRSALGSPQYQWKLEKRPYVPDSGFGWVMTQPYLTSTSYREGCGPSSNFYALHRDSYIYHDADGSAHPLDLEYQRGLCWSGTDNVAYISTTGNSPDTSGVGMWASNFFTNSPPILRSADGMILGATGAAIVDSIGGNSSNYTQFYGGYTDSNGNQKGEYPGGLDTLGRVIVTQQNGSNQVLYKYYDSSGTLQTYTVNYSSILLSTHFNISVGSYGLIIENTETRNKIDSIVLPNGRSYLFQYETNGYAGLSRIDFPTGAYVTYTWGTWSDNVRSYRYVTSRTLTVDGQSYTWNFTRGACGGTNGTNCQAFTATVTDPLLNQQAYDTDHGSVTSARSYNGSATGTPLRRYDVLYSVLHGYRSIDETGGLPTRITTTLDNGFVSKTEYDYDSVNYPYQTCGDPIGCGINGIDTGTAATSRGNVTGIREYDWGQGAPGSLLRRTKKTYLHDPNANPSTAANYVAVNIVDKVLTETICNGTVACAGNGDQAAQTQYEYDNYVPSGADANPLLSTSAAAQHDYTNFSTGFIYRGNATRVKRWRNTDSALLNTTYEYDDLGNIRLIRDPLTNTTSFSYTDSFANSSCPPPTGTNGQAWVSQATNSLAQNLQVVRYPCTGLVQAHKDQNDINASRAGTTYSYDLLGRATQKNLPDGGQVATSYNDVPPVSSTSTTKVTSVLNRVTTSIQDGLGRARKTQLTSDPDGTTYSRISYDGLGRKSQEWNPTRCDPDVNPSSCSGEPTFGVTSYTYDAFSRVTQLIPPDGTSSANNVTTAYSGNTTAVTDQAGKSRKSQTDALGRLTTVFEDPSGLNYETDYQYDVLGDLLRVDQKGGDLNSANWRTRTFTYNSLSQLLTANNPESGIVNYGYDNDGNVLTKVSPAPNQTNPSVTQTISYCYDQLNRLTGKAYSLQTCPLTAPAASYFYDQTSYNGLTIANGVGHRTGMSDAAGAEAWNYNPMGRSLRDRRTTNSVTLNSDYTYNSDGSVATEVYPSGRTITFTPGAAGRTLAATDTANSINYLTGATYAPQGALYRFTNGTSISGAMTYNSRLQPLQLYFTTGTVSSGTLTQLQQSACPTTAAGIMSRSYNFGLGTNDNGNALSITNCRDTNRTQNVDYDSLNRIAHAYTSGPNWGEAFTIDAWGNLTNEAQYLGKTNHEGLTAAPATAKNQLTGYGYDAAGNTTSGGYTYDPENRLATAGGVTYTYDGDGNRVKKSSGTLYWGTGPLAESDLTGSATSWKEYVFFSGKRVARRDASNSTVHYYFSDHLGSTSVSTNSTGTTLEEDLDYYPYGGIASGTSSDHYLFTGKERDAESGLDMFGARYYGSSLGRFMTPDWAAKATAVPYASFGNPQSLNLYSYVWNNPLSRNDPDGHTANCAGADSAQCKADLKKLAPGTKVAADGTVSKGSLLQRIVNHLDGNGAGQSLVSRIVNDSHLTTITADPGNPNGGTQLHGDVKYDPAGANVMTRGADGNLTEAHTSGTVILGHELIHQDHENRGLQDNSPADHIFSNAGSMFSETVTREEFRTTGFSPFVMHGDTTENQLERQLGAPVRATYTGEDNWVPVPQN
jgi:RHS repeat-associated protein